MAGPVPSRNQGSAVNNSTELAAQAIAMHNVKLRALLLRLLDPEDLGNAVSQEVRSVISQFLIRNRTDTTSCSQ